MSNYPTVRPSLTLDFQKSKQLDPRIAFSRSSSATYVEAGVVKTADEHQARFEKEGLLIEESRTNYCKNYSAFYNGYSNATIASGLSPAGDNTAQVITATANGMTQARTTGSNKPVNIPTNSVGITYSLYVKGSYSYFRLKIFTGATQQQVIFYNFNTDSWTVSSNNSASRPSSNYQVQDAGNGWYRLSFYASNYTGGTIGPWFDGSASLSAGDTYSVWMPQVEIGTFPTSAIPTEVASEVTRAADVCTITGDDFSSWFNESEGTVFSDHKSSQSGFTYTINNGINNDSRLGLAGAPHSGTPFANTPSSSQFGTAPTVVAGGGLTAFGYKENDYGAYGNGTALTGTSPAIVPTGLIELAIGFRGSFSADSFMNGHISRIAYYSERLTNAQLEAITS